MIRPDAPEAPQDTVKTHAFKDAQNIENAGSVGARAEAYHSAYTSFAHELQALKPQDQTRALGAYRSEMGRALGQGQLQQLELTYAGQHIGDFSAANQKKVLGGRSSSTIDSGNLDADKIGRFQSTKLDNGERAFQNAVAGDIAATHKQGDFKHDGYLGTRFGADNSYVSKDDLLAKGKDAGLEKQQAARSEALGLLSPISPELAKEFGVKGKNGAAPTIYDLLSEKDGSIKKYGYNTQFQNIHNKLRDGDLSAEQRKAVDNLWNNWSNPAQNPLKDSRTGAVSLDSIKKTTGEDLDSLRAVAQDRLKVQENPDAAAARKQAGVEVGPVKKEEGAVDPSKKSEAAADPNKKTEAAVDPAKKTEAVADPNKKTEAAADPNKKIEAATDPTKKTEMPSFTLDGDSILDHARAMLQEKMKGSHKRVSDAEVRSYVASIAKANHLPGSERQWADFVKDGKQSHLPRALNQALHRGIVLNLPTDK